MPSENTGVHSLTSVTFTPHRQAMMRFRHLHVRREAGGGCSRLRLGNCNDCPAKPETAFPYMANLARKYLRDDFRFAYRESLFSMKPILMSSEIDDSRPTVIRTYSCDPTFVSVLSGKINTCTIWRRCCAMRDKEKNFVSAVVYVHNAEKRIEDFINVLLERCRVSLSIRRLMCERSSEDGSLEK